jgi:hypothetical protein
VLAVLIVAPMLLAAAPAQAANHREAPITALDRVDWDRAAQEFVLGLSVIRGLGEAGNRGLFTLDIELTIKDSSGATVGNTSDWDIPIQCACGLSVTRDRDHLVALDPIGIPWDRNNSTAVGLHEITGAIVKINAQGLNVGQSIVVSDPGSGIVVSG